MLRQQEAVLLDVSRPRSEFRSGDIIDIETEDGMEVDVTVLGLSEGGDPSEMRVRFVDGDVDDWPTEDFQNVRTAEEDRKAKLEKLEQKIAALEAVVAGTQRALLAPAASSLEELDEDKERDGQDAPVSLDSDELPDEALAIICHFLGVRELGRFACVLRRFTQCTLTEPGGGTLLSPIEEGARLRLLSMVPGGGDLVSRNGEASWLRALWYAECTKAVFTSCSPDVVLSEEGACRDETQPLSLKTTCYMYSNRNSLPGASSHSWLSWPPRRRSGAMLLPCTQLIRAMCTASGAVATGYGFAMCGWPMLSGTNYVEFTLLEHNGGEGRRGRAGAEMGVAEADFVGPGDTPRYRREETKRNDNYWLLSTHGSFVEYLGASSSAISWLTGQQGPRMRNFKEGDVVGLLLEMEKRTLSVYLNGVLRGVMVRPGMRYSDDAMAPKMHAPLWWAVNMVGGGSVRIERKPRPLHRCALPRRDEEHCMVQ